MRHMLIVEDEPEVCKTLQEFFSTRQFLVTTAFSGEEALARLRDGPVDVLLLDILLPGINGLEVLKVARRSYPGAKIIVMSGLEDDRLQEEARQSGADDFVRKPFDLSDQTWSAILQPT